MFRLLCKAVVRILFKIAKILTLESRVYMSPKYEKVESVY